MALQVVILRCILFLYNLDLVSSCFVSLKILMFVIYSKHLTIDVTLCPCWTTSGFGIWKMVPLIILMVLLYFCIGLCSPFLLVCDELSHDLFKIQGRNNLPILSMLMMLVRCLPLKSNPWITGSARYFFPPTIMEILLVCKKT